MRPADTMTTQNSEARRRQLVIGIVAAVLLSTSGLAAVVSGSDSFRQRDDNALVRDQTANRGSAGRRCAECGVIESAAPIEMAGAGVGANVAGGTAKKRAKLAATVATNATYVAVRMADGSRRSFDDASPAKWRAGERVIVIN